MLKVNSSTRQLVEKFNDLWMVFTNDGRRNKDTDRQIGKTYVALHELHRSGDKTGAFKHLKAVGFWIGLCSNLTSGRKSQVMTERILS